MIFFRDFERMYTWLFTCKTFYRSIGSPMSFIEYLYVVTRLFVYYHITMCKEIESPPAWRRCVHWKVNNNAECRVKEKMTESWGTLVSTGCEEFSFENMCGFPSGSQGLVKINGIPGTGSIKQGEGRAKTFFRFASLLKSNNTFKNSYLNMFRQLLIKMINEIRRCFGI